MCHGKHGLYLKPTLRVCVTWKTCTFFNAYPAGMCHMENVDIVDFLLKPTLRVCVTWKTRTLFNAYPPGMCHMENMDFL